MTRRHGIKGRTSEPPDLDITSFLNLMVVLIPFLLISAVFSRVAIMELSVPTSAGGAVSNKPDFSIEVIVRKAGLEIANGHSVEAAIPNKEGKYDMKMLSDMLLRLKSQYPEKEDATVLMEPDIEYNYLIQIMDAVRSAEIHPEGDAEDGTEAAAEGKEETQRMVLFPEISIGDAP